MIFHEAAASANESTLVVDTRKVEVAVRAEATVEIVASIIGLKTRYRRCRSEVDERASMVLLARVTEKRNVLASNKSAAWSSGVHLRDE